MKQSVVLSFILLTFGVVAVAAADERTGAIVSAVPSIAVQGSHTNFGVTGSVGFRFNRAVGLELEINAIPDLGRNDGRRSSGQIAGGFAVSPGPSATFPTVRGQVAGPLIAQVGRQDGRAIMFLTNFRISIPTTLNRITPYFVGGGGVGQIRQRFDFGLPVPLFITEPAPSRPGTSAPAPLRNVSAIQIGGTTQDTELTLDIGGGVSVRVWKGLSLDVDLREYRLMGVRDQNIGRFGIGAGYRF